MNQQEKYRAIFKGNIPAVTRFFNEKFLNDKFDRAFTPAEIENMMVKQSITSNCCMFKLHKNPHGEFILIEIYFD